MITLKTCLGRCALLGTLWALTAVACQSPDAFSRNDQTGNQGQAGVGPTGTGGTDPTGTGGTDPTGTAGSGEAGAGVAGATGAAGTTGAAGATGTAGTTGSAGVTGTAGSGAGGSNSRGGTTGTAGRGGTTGTAGRGGTTGSAGTTGRAGATGTAGTTGTAGATGTAGVTGTGGAGGSAGCPTCMVELQQKCQSDTSMQAVTVTMKVINKGNMSVALSRVTIRYWFSHMITTTSTPVLEIDSPAAYKPWVKATFTDDYLQLGFVAAAGSLYPFDTTTGTGELQMRFHPADYSNWNTSQTDDYSYRPCSGGAGTTPTAWTKTTLYIDGVLAWGTEPATAAPAP